MNFFTLRFPIVSVIREPQRFIPHPKDNRTRPAVRVHSFYHRSPPPK